MSAIAENVRAVREQIAQAAKISGRGAGEITLVAASKMNDAGRVREAIAAGVDAVGENRVQELLQKRAEGAYEGTSLHFIGHLQTNKVRDVVGVCDLIESAGSARLLEEIGRRAVALGLTQDVLIEVNIGKEKGKSGVFPEELAETLEKIGEISGVSALGLMAVPPILGPERENRRFFDDMMKLFIDIQGKKYDNVSMQYLSMGMSDSFREAIEAGANMVRVGSAIFGERRYN
ncbi:MAG: YggS family pyridoxal phosphate-dependent enzyme [Oscillospiraceae bacterium]|jgi:pyridoxal phosphate enzyme (YggS family)|nr:YggS family pyridoxal phosphate-dependent enzyme [Oscillospiraceae bacterium]